MQITTFPVRPLGCNCSVIADEVSGTAIVVDPGGEFDRIRELLEEQSLRVTAIVHSHTHFDHVGATAPLQRWSGAAARIHEADRPLYDMLPTQAALFGIDAPESCEVAGDLVDEGTVCTGAIEVGIIHTPGHTPGSVSFLVSSDEGPILFSGDTLFRRGVGRTDLWGGDSAQLTKAIKQRLMVLQEDTLVVPGHGPTTTIGEERRLNPFIAR